jgi:hypothetical protein
MTIPLPAGPDANSRCPRCGEPFRCGVADSNPCPCSGFIVSEQTLSSLHERYTHCLCLRCLQAVQAGAAVDPVAGTTPAG